jgi:hypothetical protein
MQIKSKETNYRLLEKGAFGNRLRMWSSLDELIKSDYCGTVSMRYKGDVGGGFVAYEVPILKASSVQQEWIGKGAEQRRIVFNESAPDDKLLIQGELMQGIGGLNLTYSLQQMKMREALKNADSAKGLKAKLILEYFLNPCSYDDMNSLFEQFPDHAVEFSTYSMNLGSIPHRNTVIWEVRYY